MLRRTREPGEEAEMLPLAESDPGCGNENALARGPGRFAFWDPDDDLLSRDIPRTIIGATPFHGPVRDGKAWFQRAMVVRNSVVNRALGAKRHSRGSAFGKKRR